MRFSVTRRGIEVVPENDQDVAFIEDTLGLKKAGDFVPLVRQNAINLSCMGNLTTAPFPGKALVDVTASPPPAPARRACGMSPDSCKAADCETHGSPFQGTRL